MFENKLMAFTNMTPGSFTLKLYFKLKNQRGGGFESSFAQPVKFKEIPEGMEPEPALQMQWDEAHQLMDELWRIGIRPSEGAGSAGAMKATERHLEDMRKLVFHESPKPPKNHGPIFDGPRFE